MRDIETMDRYTAGGYLPASFLDWDGHVAAVVFTQGCNFRCPWCHNRELVTGKGENIKLGIIVSDIAKRKKFLDGVVLTGGEPCIWDGLFDFLRAVRDLGLSIKLDTNGSMPEILKQVLEYGLTDHVAMDVKSPLDTISLKRLTGADIRPDRLKESMGLIKGSGITYEFRTTFVGSLLSLDDMREIRKEIDDDPHWIIQCFRPDSCLDPDMCGSSGTDKAKVREAFPGIRIRG